MRTCERRIEISLGISIVAFAMASAVFSMAINNPAWIPLILGLACLGATMIRGKSLGLKR
jgi:hypothetical protein